MFDCCRSSLLLFCCGRWSWAVAPSTPRAREYGVRWLSPAHWEMFSQARQ